MRKLLLNRCLLLVMVLFYMVGASCSSSKKQTNVKKQHTKTANTSKLSGKAAKTEKTLLESYATKMGVATSKLQIPKLYTVIDPWIGVPYKYAGNTQRGVDCSGFVMQVYRSFTSKPIPRSSAELAKVIESKPLAKLREGDLVFFNYDGKNSHVGIYLLNGWFVHASTVKGVVLSDLNAPYYKKRYSKGGSLKIGSLIDFVEK